MWELLIMFISDTLQLINDYKILSKSKSIEYKLQKKNFQCEYLFIPETSGVL